MLIEGQVKFRSPQIISAASQRNSVRAQNPSQVLFFFFFLVFFVSFSSRSDAVWLIHNLWLYERASQQAFSQQIIFRQSTGVTHNIHVSVPLRSRSVHNNSTLKLKRLNRMQPLLILLFTPFVLLRL